MTTFARFTIPLHTGSAEAVRVPVGADPRAALAALSLPGCRAAVVIHGGAGGMDPMLIDAVRDLFAASLAPFAERERVMIVDGGTQAGTMAAMGAARRAVGGTFPLIGVAPLGAVRFPGSDEPDAGRPPLDPDHSHFLLVEGDSFGIESPLLVGLLRAAGVPGAALVVNGGPIVREEIGAQAAAGNPVIVVAGSGRAADELADPHSDLRRATPGLQLEIAHLAQPASLIAALERLLLAPDRSDTAT